MDIKKSNSPVKKTGTAKQLIEARRWTIISLILSIGMMAFAVVQSIQLVRVADRLEVQHNNTSDLLENTKAIFDNTATHYIDDFPTFLPKISQLISNAKEEIIIFQDVTGYGLFSSPDKFQEYIDILWKKAHDGKKISLISYNAELSYQCRSEQFGVADISSKEEQNDKFEKHISNSLQQTYDNFINFKFGEENFGSLSTHLKELNKIRDRIMFGNRKYVKEKAPIVSFDVFNQALDSMAYYLEKALCGTNQVSIYESARLHNIHYWLIDNTEAVFAFPRHLAAVEVGYRTRDGNFLNYLRSLHDDCVTRSKNHRKKCG